MIFLTLLLNGLLISGIVLFLWQRENHQKLKPYFFPALLLKCACCIVLGLLYYFYYSGGDTYGFHKQASVLSDFAKTTPVPYVKFLFWSDAGSAVMREVLQFNEYTKALSLIKLLSLLNFITGYNYYLNGIYLSIFCFAGSWFLVRTIHRLFPETTGAALVAFLFFPSVVFWASGVMKESLLLGCIFALVAIALRFTYSRYKYLLLETVLALCCVFIIWDIKFFVGGVLFPVLLAWWLVSWLKQKTPALRGAIKETVLFFVVLVTVVVVVMQLHPVLRSTNFLQQEIVRAHDLLLEKNVGQPVIVYQNLEPTFSSFIRNTPLALFSVLFRPLPGEGNSWLWWAQGLENLVLIVLFLFAIVSILNKKERSFELFHLALVVYIVVMAVFLALSTPNLGTLSRYRVVFLPFLVYLLLQNNYLIRFLGGFRAKVQA
ncbi:MAG: hypothetical protein LPK19_14210 [Hymenobacteraceae bacterium]|nr:hypothetical protein [Hymenobacteraceae bacterium]MDX5397384.1 hypothetical protein [Hymenobacteraceae bacterium]MDX5513462.1 hypothetical protein [Hymenobacteraceae bacterium]